MYAGTGKRFDPGTATATNAPKGPTQTRLFSSSSSSLPSLRTTCALPLLFLLAPICALLLLLLFAHWKSTKPITHIAIHRFRHDRHQEQDQEDNKNKWWTLPFSHPSSSSLCCWLVGNLPVRRRKREFLAFFLGWVSPLPGDAAAGCCVRDDRSNSSTKAGFLAQTLLYT